MIRGTSHIFRFDYLDFVDDITLIEEVEVIFYQDKYKDEEQIKIPKYLNECVICGESKEIVVELSPSDTIQFTDKRKLKIQIKVKAKDLNGNPFTYGFFIQNITVYPSLSDKIL